MHRTFHQLAASQSYRRMNSFIDEFQYFNTMEVSVTDTKLIVIGKVWELVLPGSSVTGRWNHGSSKQGCSNRYRRQRISRRQAVVESERPKSSGSNVLAIISLLISAVSLAVTVIFNFFWHPEDLRMHVQMGNTEAVGKGPITVSFLFTNLASQAVAIEKIALAQMSGPKAKVEDCSWWGVSGRLDQISQHPSLPTRGTLYSGAPLSYYRPTKIVVDGKESGFEPSVIAANSVRLIVASFSPDPLNVTSDGP